MHVVQIQVGKTPTHIKIKFKKATDIEFSFTPLHHTHSGGTETDRDTGEGVKGGIVSPATC